MLALYHKTYVKNFKSIIKQKKLMTLVDRESQQIYVDGMGSFGFPGVYFSLLYQDQTIQIEKEDEDDENETIVLVFPIDLIKCQQNWHYNLIDHNGLINYDTYYAHNISDAPHPNKVKYFLE